MITATTPPTTATTTTTQTTVPARPKQVTLTPETEFKIAMLRRRQAVFDSKLYRDLMSLQERNRRRCRAAVIASDYAWAKIETMNAYDIPTRGTPEQAEYDRAHAEHQRAHRNARRLHLMWKRLWFSNIAPDIVVPARDENGQLIDYGPFPIDVKVPQPRKYACPKYVNVVACP